MAKERDRIDYANLGANVAQNFHLHDLQKRRGDVATIQRGIEDATKAQAAIERQRQIKDERTETIGQCVFAAMKRLNEQEALHGSDYGITLVSINDKDHGHLKMLEDKKPMNAIAMNPPVNPEETK